MIWWWWWWCWRRCCEQEFASWWGLAQILDVHPSSSSVRFRGEVRWGMESYLSGDDVDVECVWFWVVALFFWCRYHQVSVCVSDDGESSLVWVKWGGGVGAFILSGWIMVGGFDRVSWVDWNEEFIKILHLGVGRVRWWCSLDLVA